MHTFDGSAYDLLRSVTDFEPPVIADHGYQDENEDLHSKPIGFHQNLSELLRWWSQKKSESTFDHQGHLQAVREARRRLLQQAVLAAMERRDYFLSKPPERSEISRFDLHNTPSLEESLWEEVRRRTVRNRPSTVTHSSSTHSSEDFENTDFSEPEEITPTDIEQNLQQLIDDSVQNMTWATKTLFKYKSLQQDRQELAELRRRSKENIPETSTLPQIDSQNDQGSEENRENAQISDLEPTERYLDKRLKKMHKESYSLPTIRLPSFVCEKLYINDARSETSNPLSTESTEPKSLKEEIEESETPPPSDASESRAAPLLEVKPNFHEQPEFIHMENPRHEAMWMKKELQLEHPVTEEQSRFLSALKFFEPDNIPEILGTDELNVTSSAGTLDETIDEYEKCDTKQIFHEESAGSKNGECFSGTLENGVVTNPHLYLNSRFMLIYANFVRQLQSTSFNDFGSQARNAGGDRYIPSTCTPVSDQEFLTITEKPSFQMPTEAISKDFPVPDLLAKKYQGSDDSNEQTRIFIPGEILPAANSVCSSEGSFREMKNNLIADTEPRMLHLPLFMTGQAHNGSQASTGNLTLYVCFYWDHNLKQFGIDKRRAAGIYAKIEMLEKSMKKLLGFDDSSPQIRIQSNDLSTRTLDKLTESFRSDCSQIWPHRTPVKVHDIRFLVVVPEQLCVNLREDNLREGLYYIRNIMQMGDNEILILCTQKSRGI